MLNKGIIDCKIYLKDVFVVSDAFKAYLRSLDDCLMTQSLFKDWVALDKFVVVILYRYF